MVDPRRSLQSGQHAPPLAIEEVLVDGEAAELGGTIRVPPGKRTFEFRYAGLSFLAPGRVQYRYRLDGFDPDWVEARAARSVRYTNLPPGRYGFRVTARLGQGEWNDSAAAVQLELAPRFYQRPLFLGLGLAALALAAWRAFVFRLRRLKASEQRLQLTVEERTRALQLETRKLAAADAEKSALLQQLKEQSDAFERLSKEDALTGLANRRQFDEVLAQEFARARRHRQPLTVVMADIDSFKAVNDRFSHKAGDEVLVVVARLIRESCRGTDLAARYGGEEFGMLLPQTTAEGAEVVCERIRALVASADLSAIAPGLRVTISIGISDWPEAPHPDKLIVAADEQLYAAKRAGRNRVRRASATGA
jgi:diguanylate cyclase (GGDEF)-like protein